MRFDYQQQLSDQERQQQEEELASRGLNFQSYWALREQDMKDQREFWKKWRALWQS